MASKLLKISKNFTAISQRLKCSHSADFQAALSSLNSPTELTVANNNLRVASQSSDSEITTVGLFIDAGSRYEEASNNGAGNLVHRLLLKGTTKRAQADLESEISSLGARIYSFTSRERSALYGTCLTKDVPKLVEILSDVIQNPKLSADDINKLRNDILRESSDVEANVEDVVFDYLHAVAYQGTPLGQTVLGTQENIKSLSSSDLKYYIDTHFKASRIVLAAAGGVSHKELVQCAEQNLGKLDNTFDGEAPVLSRCRYTGSEVRLRDDSLPYAYFALAVEGPGWSSPDRIPLLIASTAIGAFDRSQGNFEDAYELCHNYKAFNTTYSDTGLFGVYIVCEPMQCDEISRSALKTWHRIANSITDAELDQAKNRLITQLLSQQSSSKGICEDIGNSILSLGRRAPLGEVVASIQNISNQTVRDVTDKYTSNKCLVVSAVGPVEQLMDYVNLRARMYLTRL
ncbi:mitochondrial-processing peptidase subunit beta-like [Contarinia nasturtii]|uniref:mitochondrial-processing peptidase subunit beta-like n=1 Tax=Contarinia nasturtii TaxID=265458 RepID=UPI0012D3CCF9|nr:mitochondrial-processing peptidase subunit beta-like [Contarinia nasturtii]